MRLIDCETLEKAIYKWMPKDQETWMDSDLPPIENLVVSIMMTIQEQPIVDAEPVRHGKWIYGEHEIAMCDGYRCSKCGYFVPWDYGHKSIDYIKEYNYCPNCGAKMDEVEKEE